MSDQPPRMFRVKAVAEMLDVSKATVYRAIESGELRALKVGTGKGALRVPEDAFAEYKARCEQAAVSTSALPEVA
jgi:excisionase family DNA binding protein